jgi:hypothetical protein
MPENKDNIRKIDDDFQNSLERFFQSSDKDHPPVRKDFLKQ